MQALCIMDQSWCVGRWDLRSKRCKYTYILSVFDLKRCGSDRSVFDIKVPQGHFKSIRNHLWYLDVIHHCAMSAKKKKSQNRDILGNLEILASWKNGTYVVLFHRMVRHGTVQYGSLLGGFPLGTVPGTWYFFSIDLWFDLQKNI